MSNLQSAKSTLTELRITRQKLKEELKHLLTETLAIPEQAKAEFLQTVHQTTEKLSPSHYLRKYPLGAFSSLAAAGFLAGAVFSKQDQAKSTSGRGLASDYVAGAALRQSSQPPIKNRTVVDELTTLAMATLLNVGRQWMLKMVSQHLQSKPEPRQSEFEY